MKITMIGPLKTPLDVEQIICAARDVGKRIRSWDKRGYELLEVKSIDRYTTLMRFFDRKDNNETSAN